MHDLFDGRDDVRGHDADGARRLDVQHRRGVAPGALDHPRARARRRLGRANGAGGQAMSWGSLSEFLAMGGYGLYVWGSYAVTAGLIVVEITRTLNRAKFDADPRVHS